MAQPTGGFLYSEVEVIPVSVRFAIVVSLLLALPRLTNADILVYEIAGDVTVTFLGVGSQTYADALTGMAKIDTSGGSPSLEELDLRLEWSEGSPFLDGLAVSTCCAGSTVQVEMLDFLGPNDLPELGTGSITTSINWGSLTSWTQQSGRQLTCNVYPGPACPGCDVPCTGLFGFTGTGLPPFLSATDYDTDPWTFSGSGDSFSSPFFEITNLGGGAFTQDIEIKGEVADVTEGVGKFCIVGDSTGLDWSWEIDTAGTVDVTNPGTGATATDLALAFVNSINLPPNPPSAAVSSPANCFSVTPASSPFLFKVGPKGGPSACTVSGSSTGCPFNPFIFEEEFLPFPVPAVPRWGIYLLGLLLLVLVVPALSKLREGSRVDD